MIIEVRARKARAVPVMLDNVSDVVESLKALEVEWGVGLGVWSYCGTVQIDAADLSASDGDWIVVNPCGRVEVMGGAEFTRRFESTP